MWTFKIYVNYILLTLVSSLSNSHKKEDQFYYLNQQRPLWILNDQVSSKERDTITENKILTNNKLENSNQFRLLHQSRQLFPLDEASPKHISIPKNYIYAGKYNYNRRYDALKKKSKRRTIQSMFIPISKQSMPRYKLNSNDDVLGPIFIFNGPKGELILNTLLEKQKLSLSEPVPGKILNLPESPLFHPKPIVQRYRVPGDEILTNFTLIPFFAHEANIPNFLTETTDQQTAILYASQTSESVTMTTPKPTKKRRYKKARNYTVYRSPDEVQWRPTEDSSFTISEPTTPYPMVLASPLANHRYKYESFDRSTTMKPNPTNRNEKSQFQIVYFEESLESPMSREAMPTRSPRTRLDLSSGIKYSKPLPLLSSHYSAGRKYYAFPVYTLGKLLKSDTVWQPPELSKRDDTWLILNSRYKGPHLEGGFDRLSSKYIEVPSETKDDWLDEGIETTLEQSILL